MRGGMICRILAVFCMAMVMGCGRSEGDSETDKLYEEVCAAENMPVQEAYEKLGNCTSANAEQTAFIQKLKDLMDCSGKFAYASERGDVYSADVSFYLSSGDVYGSVSYSGYMGEIKDGLVSDTTEAGYLFESDPKGDLCGNEQDFHLYFGKEQLHIMWAESCDYILDRGDGSAESVEDYKVPFDQTDTYKKLEELLDQHFSEFGHDLVYDEEKRELNIYVEAPENLRSAMNTRDSSLLDSWQKLVESMTTLSDTLLKVVEIGGRAFYVNIYWVDSLNDEHEYTESDYLVWIQNGVVKYDYSDHLPNSSTPAGASKESRTSEQTAGVSSGSGNDTATFGEKNALKKAQQYLEYTAFSYTGLIEQLEFEGFTNEQVEYAVSKFY